jgi:hypothetical protein
LRGIYPWVDRRAVPRPAGSSRNDENIAISRNHACFVFSHHPDPFNYPILVQGRGIPRPVDDTLLSATTVIQRIPPVNEHFINSTNSGFALTNLIYSGKMFLEHLSNK